MLHWLLGFLIPTAFLIVGVIAKKLVSKTPGWDWPDFFLGIELTLTALSACVLNACDLYRSAEKAENRLEAASQHVQNMAAAQSHKFQAQADLQAVKDFREEQGRNTVVLAMSFIAFLYAGTVHQKWEKEADGKMKRWMLAGVSNFCGYFPLVCYMLWVKGVS